MKIAIYSRKSKLTDRGESIQNQVDMCKNYIFAHFDVSEKDIAIYEDEGFSGGNTDRPEFQKLIRDVSKKRINAVVCYKLDRISRNVLDFSNVLETLNKYNASFISITEHFDTTTPMGRAMVNIAAVFAQLERETIAERIRDNMRRLARTGRYIGSTPPTGFKSERIDYIDANGNKKKMHKLTPTDDMDFVKLIYEKYLEFESLSKVETWLMRNNYKNKNENFSGVTRLRRMLTNPVYVRADETIYEYYKAIGSDLVNPKEEFNGKSGMLLYGKHDRNNSVYDPTKWTIVIAAHEGIIEPEKWLSIQQLLDENKVKAPRAGTSRNALLTSKIKCGECGGTMVVIYGANRKRHYYKCRNKIKSRKALCNIKNIIGCDADEDVLQHLKNLSRSKDNIIEIIRKQKNRQPYDDKDLKLRADNIKKEIREKETEIKNLTLQLRKNSESNAVKYIISDIETLDNELKELKNNLELLEEQKYLINSTMLEDELVVNRIMDFARISDSLSFEEKRKYIDKMIDKILWNGESLSVIFK